VYCPFVGVTLAPAFLWSITIAPLMMRFLKPRLLTAEMLLLLTVNELLDTALIVTA
jgi:hypothetical protein